MIMSTNIYAVWNGAEVELYPNIEASSRHWRTVVDEVPNSEDYLSIGVKANIDLDLWRIILDHRSSCVSTIGVESKNICETDLIEGFINLETDYWNAILGRYSYRIGTAVSTNPSNPIRAGMRNEQGPFAIEKGADLFQLSRFLNDDISLGFLTVYEKGQNELVPYITVDYSGEYVQSRFILGSDFYGQSMSATPFDSLVLYLDYNIHRGKKEDSYFSDGVFGSRISIPFLPMTLSLEYIRNAHGLANGETDDHLYDLDIGMGSVVTSERYDYYNHKKPGSEDNFSWGANQWLSRDLIFMNIVTHFQSNWAPILRGFYSLSDSSSLLIMGTQFVHQQDGNQFSLSVENESYRGDRHSEYGWVASTILRYSTKLTVGVTF